MSDAKSQQQAKKEFQRQAVIGRHQCEHAQKCMPVYTAKGITHDALQRPK